MDTTDDRDGDHEWNTKDVLVAIEVRCSGDMDDEIPKRIIEEELDGHIYSDSSQLYKFIVKTVTFTDRLN